MHAHIKAGWTFSEYAGDIGGWELDLGDGYTRIACRTADSRKWQGFIVRNDDGATIHHSEHQTRDDAMRRVSLALAG